MIQSSSQKCSAVARLFSLVLGFTVLSCAPKELTGNGEQGDGASSESGSIQITVSYLKTWVKDDPELSGSSPVQGRMCFLLKDQMLTAGSRQSSVSGHVAFLGLKLSAHSVPPSAGVVEPVVQDAVGDEQPEETNSAGQEGGDFLGRVPEEVAPEAFACTQDFLSKSNSQPLYVYAEHIVLPGSEGKGLEFDGRFLWPVPLKVGINSPYGKRGGRMHWGVDMEAPLGTPIFAAASGRVVARRNGDSLWTEKGSSADGFGFGAYGNIAFLSHGQYNGKHYSTLYAHFERVTVAKNDALEQKDVLGEMGSTGRSTGPHLHFEVWTGNWKSKMNPAHVLVRK